MATKRNLIRRTLRPGHLRVVSAALEEVGSNQEAADLVASPSPESPIRKVDLRTSLIHGIRVIALRRMAKEKLIA